MRRSRALITVGIIVIIAVALVYRSVSPIGGIRVSLGTSLGKGVEIHYSLWTVASNGSIVTLKSGETGGSIAVSSDVVKRVRDLARARNSSSGILFVDAWARKGGRVYALPLQSFEIPVEGRWYEAKRIHITLLNPVSVESGNGVVWKTVHRDLLRDFKVPLTVVQKNTNVSLLVDLRINSYSDYVGPKVTVVYAGRSAKNVSDVKIHVLDSAFTGVYYIGIGGEVKGPSLSWMAEGVYMKLLVMEQEEYVCGAGDCRPAGLFRYLLIPLGMKYRGSNPMMIQVWREDGNGTWGWEPNLSDGITLVPTYGVIMGGVKEPALLYNIYKKPWSSNNMTHYAVGVATPAGYELRQKLNWLPRWFNSVPIVVGNSIAGSLCELKSVPEVIKVYGAETLFNVTLKTSPTNGSTVTTMPFGYYFYVRVLKHPCI
ncbi:MAG: hypothetical protein GXO14_02170 [Thermococci archaeon]|nr:hypothetical protein [Thermococci archaeon]